MYCGFYDEFHSGREIGASEGGVVADDTLVYIVCDNLEIATQKLNEDLVILFNTLCQNKLKLNVDKTNPIESKKCM